MPICPGMSGCLSMSILASFTLPLAPRTAFSSTGVSCLHGPHHVAQKSTSTGWRFDSSMTSAMKACVVVSLTRVSAAAAAPPFCNMLPLQTLAVAQVPSTKWSFAWRMQSALQNFGRRAGNALNARFVSGRLQEFHQVVTRNRCRHRIEQRMEVESIVLHHCRIEHHHHARVRVVDGAEWRDRAWLDAPGFAQQVRRPEGKAAVRAQ